MNNGEEYDDLADIFKGHPSKKSFVRLSETFICFNTFVSIISHQLSLIDLTCLNPLHLKLQRNDNLITKIMPLKIKRKAEEKKKKQIPGTYLISVIKLFFHFIFFTFLLLCYRANNIYLFLQRTMLCHLVLKYHLGTLNQVRNQIMVQVFSFDLDLRDTTGKLGMKKQCITHLTSLIISYVQSLI